MLLRIGRLRQELKCQNGRIGVEHPVKREVLDTPFAQGVARMWCP